MKRMPFYIVFALMFFSLTAAYLWWHGVFLRKGDIAGISIKGVGFSVELARTPAERSKGLSGHEPLGENKGMLFVFERPTTERFWMKGMLFPIDLFWIADGKITGIEKDMPIPKKGEIVPRIYHSPTPIDYVLEAPAGTADRNGFAIGDEVVINR